MGTNLAKFLLQQIPMYKGVKSSKISAVVNVVKLVYKHDDCWIVQDDIREDDDDYVQHHEGPFQFFDSSLS